MNHLPFIIFSLLLSLTGTLNAQLNPEDFVRHELGIRMDSPNDFDFIYKVQTDENKFCRYRLGLFDLDLNINRNSNTANLRIESGWGFERRRPLTEKVKFLYGWEISAGFGLGKLWLTNTNLEDILLSLGTGWVLGFQLDFTSEFYLSIETIPGLGLNYNIHGGTIPNQLKFNAGFDSNAIAITLAYCFLKNVRQK